MKSVRASLKAARGLFARAFNSEAAHHPAVSHGAASTSSDKPTTALQRLIQNPMPKSSGEKFFAATGLGVGAVGAFGTMAALTMWSQGSFSLERRSPRASSATAAQRQDGWSHEQLQRVERASPPLPSLLPGLGPHFIADAAAKAAPAVVNLTVKPQKGAVYADTSSGSGFILEATGTVVTNMHVVRDALDTRAPASDPAKGAGPVIVALQDGRTFEGRICAMDQASDLALVKIEASEPLPVAELGTSKGLRVGEWILALGSPLHLQNTVTAGIVSCVERKAAELGLAPGGCEFIQMDAAINKGNSGGPIVNINGQVVGISHTTALMSNGVSFAIPIDTAKHVIHQLEVRGRVRRPLVGMKLLELNAANAAQLRARDATFPCVAAGILVPSVTPHSPAHAAGLKAGDVIIGFAGGNTDREHLSTARLVRSLGDHVDLPMQLQVLRPKSGPLTLEVTPREASNI